MASIGPASSPDDSNTEEEFASRDSSEKENRDQGKDFAKIAVKDEVKSSAVVRYSRVQQLSMYSELKQHTDLKHPPANWLRSGSKLTFHNTWGTSRTRFSSFGMAHSSPDTVGDVDIISASENIKTLLKIPFCKAQVSIAVHRIGRTLFLDEFDIYRHLLSAPQSGRNWLRNFILHQISQDDGKQKFTRKRKTRDDLHSRSLLSKFLYYSIDSVGHGNENAEPYTVEEPTDSPDPRSSGTTQEDTVGDPPWVNGNEFARQVLWHFEDIQMLLGTDLPIFGGGKYPAVSLRLRDETKPINVLTGLDYWLDNLICNVPELAMCYHLNGIVQNYELLNTEEIPKLEDSQFSPRVIKDVAQNILSFLKSNCTKVGHTYWLFKGNNDDVVKLYDLSSLCSEAEAQWENPFSVPVAVLLYKVAKNMQQSNTKDRDKTTISKLLKNCLSLLDKEKHPQIVTSASYLLSDLCIPDTHLKTSQIEKSSDDDDDDDEEEEEEEEDKDDNDDDENEESCHSNTHSSSYGDGERDEENSDCSKSLEVKSLSLPSKHWHWREIEKRGSSTSSNHDNIKARKCEEALNYIVVGLTAIDRDLDSKSSTGRSPSHCAIEFPDVSQNEHKSTTNQNDDAAVSQDYKTMTVARRQFAPGSWQEEMKLTLLQKARVVCQAYANVLMKQNKLGDVLRYLQMALMCHSAVVHMLSSNTESGMSSLAAILSSCGDVHVMLAGHPENVFKYKDHFVLPSQHEQILTESIERIISANRVQWAVKWPVTVEECLVSSVRCYEASINESGSQDNPEDIMNVTRRLGNARNELGKLYMKQAVDTAEQVQDDDESPSKEEEILWKKSFGYFEGALKVFDAVNDTVNQALVNCNAGRLMRICAQAYNIGRFSQQERHYYNKAINYYQTAMRQLGDENSPIRESVSWELSTTYFTMATLLQDNAPLEVMAQEEVEKNIKDCMIKALKYCDVGEGSPRQPITQYRAATIHHRLASMHHNSYRNQLSDQKKKHCRTLAELHYGKAINLFRELERPSEMLRVILERVAMCEHHFNGQNAHSAKIKTMLTALDFLLQSKKALEDLIKSVVQGYTKNESKQSSNIVARTEKDKVVEGRETDNGQPKEHKVVERDTTGKHHSCNTSQDECQCKKSTSVQDKHSKLDYEEASEEAETVARDNQCTIKEQEEIEKLLTFLQARMQFVLLQLVKLHSNKKSDQKLLIKYKKMYATSLSSKDKDEGNFTRSLLSILNQITELSKVT